MSKVLVVDDKAQSLYMLSCLLGSDGHDVVMATDGAGALDKAREELPDLVVSDVMMPGMDGFTLCREWRRDELLKRVPFLFYTGEYLDEGDEELGVRVGADGFLRKPLDPDILLETVRETIGRGADAVPPTATDDGPDETDTLKLYGTRVVHKLEQLSFELDEEVYGRELAEEYLSRLNRALRMLTECSRALVRSGSEHGLLLDVCRIIVDVGGYGCAWVGFTKEGGGLSPAACVGSDGPVDCGPNPEGTPACRGACPAAKAVLTGRPEVVRGRGRKLGSECRIPHALAMRSGAQIALPIRCGTEVIGALSVLSARSDSYGSEEVALLTELADDLSYGIGATREHEARSRVEEELRESEQRFRLLTENAGDLIWAMDMDLRYTYVSPAIGRLRGYGADETLGLGLEDTVAPGSLELARRVFAEELAMERDPSADPSRSRTLELEMKCKDGSTIWSEAKMSFLRGEEGRAIAVLGVTRDITERRSAAEELRRGFAKLGRTLEGAVRSLASVVEMRDPYTAGHQRRVADLAASIAQEIGLSEEEVDTIRTAAIVHDVGKMSIPAEILMKPGSLTSLEFEFVRLHAEAGYEVVRGIEFPGPVADVVRQHHERLDGSGYPRGLKGDGIAFGACVLAVADVVEAMSSHRPYRPALGIEMALSEIVTNRGKLYDPTVVDACLCLFRDGRVTLTEG